MPRLSKIGAAALAAFGWTGLSSVTASYLVVAGGGGAGSFGGGGAGGFQTGTTSLNPTQSFTVTVGAGGPGVVSGPSGGGTNGTNGVNSQFGTLTASVGGGAGGGYITNLNGSTGGSGGGGGYFGTAGAATSGQGNAGGVGNVGGAGGGGANATTGVGSNGGGSGGGGPVTAITEPIRNNDNFIRNAYPTIVNDVLQFQTGNMSTVKKLNIQVTSINGAVVYQRVTGYENGRVPMNNFMRGTYVLTITSSDRKYQYTKKIIKN
jgi:hypothetical protein